MTNTDKDNEIQRLEARLQETKFALDIELHHTKSLGGFVIHIIIGLAVAFISLAFFREKISRNNSFTQILGAMVSGCIVAFLSVILIGCSSPDHTNIGHAGDDQGDVFLIEMCQDKKNQSLYQCKELCKVYVCE